MINIFVGTTSKLKLNALEDVLNSFKTSNLLTEYRLLPKKVNGTFPITPYGKETFTFAKKRAQKLFEEFNQKGSLFVGIESGLVKRNGYLFEECWCVVIDSNKKLFVGYSSGLSLPSAIVQKMKKGHAHADILAELDKELNATSVNETWGTYTKNHIQRHESIKESCRNSIFFAIESI